MHRHRLGSVLLLALVGACQDIVYQAPDPVIVDLSGEWDFAFRLPGDEGGSCLSFGTANVTQHDSAFAGLLTRYSGGCSAPLDSITGGSITDTVVRFSAADCTFAGAFSGASPDSITGTASCSWGPGTWWFGRVGPPSSVTVVPSARSLAVGGTQRFVATLLDAAGLVLYGRPVAWSSTDTAVATVDTAGLVRAIGAGSVAIRATVAGVTGQAAITVAAATLGAVAAGGSFTCALSPTGAWCWGLNDRGQLGDGTWLLSAAPVPVSGPVFDALAAGPAHACGRTPSGALACWGANASGQLGDGTTVDRGTAVMAADSFLFSGVVAGAYHTCGLVAPGRAWCWGGGGSGQLGDSSRSDRVHPVPVRGGTTFTALAAGDETTCALTAAGAAWCWGLNRYGKTGTGQADSNVLAPTPVQGGLTFTALAVGRLHTCGIATGGVAYCWGAGVYGQLGTGSRANASAPMPVAGAHTFTAITTTQDHTCALDAAGAAWCWGSNGLGQGAHAAGNEVDVPTAVTGGLVFGALSAGGTHTCGRTTAGQVWCWGGNFWGQVGDGTRVDRHQPVRVVGQP